MHEENLNAAWRAYAKRVLDADAIRNRGADISALNRNFGKSPEFSAAVSGQSLIEICESHSRSAGIISEWLAQNNA